MTAARVARLVAIAAIGGAAGCRPPAPAVENIATPSVGVSIALYRDGDTSFGVVDDRRWVEVTGTTLVLPHVDPAAALPSLVIEPLGASPLTVGQCAREHVSYANEPTVREAARAADHRELVRVLRGESESESESEAEAEPASDVDPVRALVVSALRCQVSGAPGRHLIRLLYVSPGLGYRAQHDVTMSAGDRATIATRFAIETPMWSAVADVTLFQGVPGGESTPLQIARGTIQLDGSTAVIAAAPREVPASLRWIFDGAVHTGRGVETDAVWGRESVRAVWVWLEIADHDLPIGPVHAHVEAPGEAIRDVEVPAGGRQLLGGTLRLPLWIDDTLHGSRTRVVMGADGASLADRFVISVANTGEQSREVWIEERLRTAKRRVLRGGWPTKPSLAYGRARTKLVVKPGAMERTGYMIEYVF